MSIMHHGPGAGLSGWGAPVPIALDVFTAEILSMYEPPMRALGTYYKFRQLLTIVAELLGEGATTAGLNPGLVGKFIARQSALGLSNNTIVSQLATLRAVCSYAESRCYLNVSPFRLRRSWLRRTPTLGKQHHSLENIARVLELARRETEGRSGRALHRARLLQALVNTVAFTGLRAKEALRLKVEDVVLADRMILLVARGHNFKTISSAQPIPIPAALAEILEHWIPLTDSEWLFPCKNLNLNRPWTNGSPGCKPLDRLKQLGERAGVHGFTFQSLRHSWATHAEFWGLSELVVMRVLRHTNVQTQQHYRHADMNNLRAKTDGISFGPAPGGAPVA